MLFITITTNRAPGVGVELQAWVFGPIYTGRGQLVKLGRRVYLGVAASERECFLKSVGVAVLHKNDCLLKGVWGGWFVRWLQVRF